MTLTEWMQWQRRVFARWARVQGVALTDEHVMALATAFASKHADRRPAR